MKLYVEKKFYYEMSSTIGFLYFGSNDIVFIFFFFFYWWFNTEYMELVFL